MSNEIMSGRLGVLGPVRSADQADCCQPKRRIGNRKRVILLVTVCALVVASRPLSAALMATAEITGQQIGNTGTYQYDITLNDTGTTNIETFWYAWIPSPSEGFLNAQPSGIADPTGWTDSVTDAYAIRWETSTAALTSGNSLSFQFDSTDAPSAVFGNSVEFPTMPVGTSFVYAGAAFSTPSLEFVVQSTPEPSTLVLFAFGLMGLLLAARRPRGGGRLAASP